MIVKETTQQMYNDMGISNEVYAYGEEILTSLQDRFARIDQIAELNQLKIINAMQKCRVSEACLGGTTGYGYNDLGRDTLERVYAEVFHTEDALGLIPDLFAAILDRGGEYPARSDVLQIMRGSDIRIEADPPLPVQFDGETVERFTPFRVRMMKGAARFVVSEECEKAYLPAEREDG